MTALADQPAFRAGYKSGYAAGRRAANRTHLPVRWRDGYEMRCSTCLEWWPLDGESWIPKQGMARCLACWRAYKAAKQRGYTAEDATKAARNDAQRARYHANRRHYNEQSRAWRARNREKVAAYNAKYRAEHREETLARSRAYYAEARPVILAKKRAAHRGEVAA